MKEKWKHIFEPDNCPSIEDLRQYIEGNLPSENMASIGDHLSDCELCQDVLLGLKLVQRHESLDQAEYEIKSRIETLLSTSSNRSLVLMSNRNIALAASLVLLIGLGFLLYLYSEHRIYPLRMQVTSTTILKKLPEPLSMKIQNPLPKYSYNLPIRDRDSFQLNSKAKMDTLLLSDNLSPITAKNLEHFKNDSNTYKSIDISQLIQKEENNHGYKTISGIVVDNATKNPLPGVNIVIKGTSRGVVTDINGKYLIHIPIEDTAKSLVFSYIGYKAEEKAIEQENYMEIAMNIEANNMSEIVVIGYGTQRKKSVTASISNFKSENLTSQNASVNEKIKGKKGNKIDNSMNDKETRSNYKRQVQKFIEMKWADKAVITLDSLKHMTSDSTEVKKMNVLIKIILNGEYKKAEKEFKKIK